MRVQIDTDVPRRLIASQFPQWASLPVRPVEHDGWDNRTFRLGDELSVRLPTGPWYAQQVEKEQRWLPVLAPQLPFPIPTPVARGEPDGEFPYPWSVYRWLEGDVLARTPVADQRAIAGDIAAFLRALEAIDATDGPLPGEHNFYRGGPLAHYEGEALEAIETLGADIPRDAVLRVWETAMATSWDRDPVWFHGDIAVGNLLLRPTHPPAGTAGDGGSPHGGGDRLAAVLDFGTSGIGDPACDMAIAWTYFRGDARDRFRAARAVDDATWARGRGWCLWKTLITLAGGDAPDERALHEEIAEMIADHAR